MAKYELEALEELAGSIKLYKLMKNGESELVQFYEQISTEGNLTKELAIIDRILDDLSEGKWPPPKKFKEITPKKEIVKEYEIKTRNLRVYLFHESQTGKIVVCGGKKSTQKKDILHFRNMKTAYLNQ